MEPDSTGASSRAVRGILFVDMDGVTFQEGTDQFITGAVERIKELQKDWELVAFTCRPPGPWMQKLTEAGCLFSCYFHKPLAAQYGWIDDRLALDHCKRSLTDG